MDFSRLHQSYEAVQNSAPKSTKCVVKNLVTLCAGTVIFFTSYDALTMLQSTMNRTDGIGVISQATLYAFFCISAILLPKFFISRFGSKKTSVAAMFGYLPYIASNYYPHWGLMLPSSILLGIAGPLLWASHGVYLNGLSLLYSTHGEQTVKKDINSKSAKMDISSKSEKMDISSKTAGINAKKKSHDGVTQQKYLLFNTRKDFVELNHDENKEATPKRQDSGEPCKITSHSSDAVSKSSNQPQGSAKSSFPEYQDSKSNQNSISLPYEGSSEENETKRLVEKATNFVLSSTTAKFFGFHGMAHLSSHVWSSLLSYFTLKTDALVVDYSNSSCKCGAEYCSILSECFEYNAGNPGANARIALTSICVCMCLISILIVALFLDAADQEKSLIYCSFDFLNATCTILKRNEMLLLIPLSMHTGLVQAFYIGDFNKAFVACAWGTHHVGLVAMCYGVCCGVSSVLSGWWVRHCGRSPAFTLAAAVNLIAVLFLFGWTPDAKFPKMFFVASGLWGIHVGIVWSQLRAFYGVLFKPDDEAAFSAFHFWSGLGSCVAFGCSNFFCISHKLYAVLALSVLGFSGYYTVEFIYCKNNKDSY